LLRGSFAPSGIKALKARLSLAGDKEEILRLKEALYFIDILQLRGFFILKLYLIINFLSMHWYAFWSADAQLNRFTGNGDHDNLYIVAYDDAFTDFTGQGKHSNTSQNN
jgi:hypothetical protein